MAPFSVVSLLAATAIALLSVGIVFYQKRTEIPSFLIERKRSKTQSDTVLFTLTPQERSALLQGRGLENATAIRHVFQREGYVIIRRLLDESMLDSLDAAADVFAKEEAQQKPATFSALRFGPVYLSPPNTTSTNTSPELAAFRQASMESLLPQFIAQVLLQLNPQHDTLRVLKDVYLQKGNESDYCGWHVDDQTFWPISYNPSQTQGVNAWIALTEIPAKHGGGLAVSPKSHFASWRQEAYETIGSTPTYPENGYDDVKDMFGYPTTTCNLAKAAPELATKIDSTKHVFDFERGDVLIHTRWLFHRSVPLSEEGLAYYKSIDKTPSIGRYSIRYEVGSARLLQGFSMEPSVVLEKENSGKSLDTVCRNGQVPWYPICWPEISTEEMSRLHEITEEQLPAYEPLKKDLFQKVLPYFRKS